MASKMEKKDQNQNQNHQPNPEEGKIPAFTVLKNGAILKNIFIVNKPPEETKSTPPSNWLRRHYEDVLLVGRHPDCDIMLTHPSISRFHLQIHSNPSSQYLSVLDLSSVHGTWVSEWKLEPGVSVEMKEGDTLRIGVSSRVYRLHWIPISRAYDLENPFVSELDVVLEAENGEEEEDTEEKAETVQKLNVCPVEIEEIQSEKSVLETVECINSGVLDENLELTVKKEIPSAPPMPEDIISFCCAEEMKSPSKDETIEVPSDPFRIEKPYLPTSSDLENKLCDSQKQVISTTYVESVVACDDRLKIEAYPDVEMPRETNLLTTLREYLTESICFPVVEAIQGTKMQQFHTPPGTVTSSLPPGVMDSFEKHWMSLLKNINPASFDGKSAASAAAIPKAKESEFRCTLRDNDKVEDILTAEAGIFSSENTYLPAEEVIPDTKFQQRKADKEVAVDSLSDGDKQDNCGEDFKSKLQAHLNPKFWHEQGHSLDEMVQDIGNECTSSICPISLQVESMNSPVPDEAVLNITNKKENWTLQSPIDVARCSEMDISFDKKNAASAAVVPNESEFGFILRNNDRVEDILTSEVGIFNSENVPLPVEEDIPDTKFKQIKVVEEVAVDSLSEGEKQDKCGEEYKSKLQVHPNAKSCCKQGHSLDEQVQDIGNKCIGSICPISLEVESVNSSVPAEDVFNITNKEENWTLQSPIDDARCPEMQILESHVEAMEKKSTFGNIWSRRGKAASAPQIQTSKSISKNTTNVDSEVEMSKEKDIINKTISKDLFSVLNGEEEEIFTPDKENFSPNALQLRFLKKKGKLEEIKHSKTQRSHNSNANISPNIYPDESMSPTSNKENQSPKVAQEYKSGRKPFGSLIKENQSPKVTQEYKSQRKPFGSHIELAQEEGNMALKNKVERVPFRSLMNSGDKSRSVTSGHVSAGKSIDGSNCGQILDKQINPSHISGQPRRSWDMVVDTASLINKESRKALQLLQGLRGTRLIVPRLVIRELDSMKRQFTIFRRISEAALALEWIEECMVNTKWWIHIQSSMEEERLIAPTPPASPQTQFSEDCWTLPGGIGSLQSLSSHKSSMEIASPTVEDHILDFALHYRRKQNDGQLVLLSDDVTLKIKCMAEGLLCETVKEFRESLVNPFSERFLWANSSPRGLTWSCQDDVVLREKYCPLPLRKSSKGVARGLKLILLHNSQYGQ